MTHFGTLRSYKFTNDADDIRGAKIYGRDDEKLGKIDDVIFDHASGDLQYAVVDTGGWLTHKQFVIPADKIEVRAEKSDASDLEYAVNLTKKEIENFPRFDEEHLKDDKKWNDYQRDYKSASDEYYERGPIMHYAGSSNMFTDPNAPAASDSIGSQMGKVDTRIRHQSWGKSEPGLMNTSGSGIGASQDEDRLSTTSSLKMNPPDVDTTETDVEDNQFDRAAKRVSGVKSSSPSAGANAPFRDAEVGAAGLRSDELEQRNMRRDQAEYEQARRGEKIPGESGVSGGFVAGASSVSSTQVRDNQPKASDTEFVTAEGDSRFNVADPQEAAYARRSDASPEVRRESYDTQEFATGSAASERWSRFQNRLREHRQNLTNECALCSTDEHTTDRGLHRKGDKDKAA